jgi:tetratricopeptide (TPR) repeat protein
VRHLIWIAFVAAAACVAVITLPAQISFHEELNHGVQSYKAANYAAAIQHFRNATDLDPKNAVAHLYLATTYAQQYIPGVNTPDNNRLADSAISEYEAVLQINPQSMDSMKGIGYLQLQSKRFDEAKLSFRKAIEVDPKDPETYYSVGVIDWTQAYTKRMAVFSNLNLTQDQSLISKAECWEVRSANEAAVQDGMEMLTKAIELRPDYDDAMAYMNLIYRERANIQCSDPTNYRSDMDKADHWVDMTLNIKKTKAERNQKQTAQPPDPR